jgi:hypothetical protein
MTDKETQAELAPVKADGEYSITKTQAQGPHELLRLAVAQNADVDKLEKLMALQERWDAAQARRAFFVAFTKFQSICPTVQKSDKAYKTKYATLERIVSAVRQPLMECGLSYRHEIHGDGDSLTVTCIITHIDGHSERTSMTAPPDKGELMNAIQGRSSTVEYLSRYTLKGVLGIVCANEDDDGNAAGVRQAEAPKTISAGQVKVLRGLLDHIAKGAELEKSLYDNWGISSLEQIAASQYDKLTARLNAIMDTQSE